MISAVSQTVAGVETLSWVVGSRGLLGSAVCRRLVSLDRQFFTSEVPWDDADLAVTTLLDDARRLIEFDRPWRIFWCAGAGVIGTTQAEFDREVEVLGRFAAGLVETVASRPARGAFFLASSGGGVYAGSADPPFTEDSAPVPISPYGHAKLASEAVVERLGTSSDVATYVGRIANLYGPGQNISKPQGLISQLCRAYLTRDPISIYVSLDTARDYLYVDDAAALVTEGLERAAQMGGQHVKVMATQRPVSIAAILAELRRVTRRRPQVVLGASSNARFQAKNLSFRSLVWTDLDVAVRTPLAAGIKITLESLNRELLRGTLQRR